MRNQEQMCMQPAVGIFLHKQDMFGHLAPPLSRAKTQRKHVIRSQIERLKKAQKTYYLTGLHFGEISLNKYM